MKNYQIFLYDWVIQCPLSGESLIITFIWYFRKGNQLVTEWGRHNRRIWYCDCRQLYLVGERPATNDWTLLFLLMSMCLWINNLQLKLYIRSCVDFIYCLGFDCIVQLYCCLNLVQEYFHLHGEASLMMLNPNYSMFNLWIISVLE